MPFFLASPAAIAVAKKLLLLPSVITIMYDALEGLTPKSRVPSSIPMDVVVPPVAWVSASTNLLKSLAELNVEEEAKIFAYCTYDAIPPLSNRFRSANAATVSIANFFSSSKSEASMLPDPSRTRARFTFKGGSEIIIFNQIVGVGKFGSVRNSVVWVMLYMRYMVCINSSNTSCIALQKL